MNSLLRKLPALAAATGAAMAAPAAGASAAAPEVVRAAAAFFPRSIYSSSVARGTIADGHGHVTGIEREELEFEAEKGVNPFAEEWSTGPLGTLEKPKEVPSYYDERIVGVVDPDDDSHLIWGTVKAGESPKQIIEGGEFFVLKKLEGGPAH